MGELEQEDNRPWWRRRIVELVYYPSFKVMSDDPRWRKPLVESLALRPGERVLDISAVGAQSAVELAMQFPKVHVVGVGADEKGLVKARQHVASRSTENLELLLHRSARLPFEAGSFDKVVSSLVLHQLRPEEKLGPLREMFRVLRHGGTLHIANFDAPETPREHVVLKCAGYLFGHESVLPHLNGSWVDILSKIGFAGVRRLSSHSVFVGRVSIVRGRRP